MANDIARLTCSGRIGRINGGYSANNGNPYAFFSIAVGRAWPKKNQDGTVVMKEETGKPDWNTSTTWLRCVAYGAVAEALMSKVDVGDKIFLEATPMNTISQVKVGDQTAKVNMTQFRAQSFSVLQKAAPKSKAEDLGFKDEAPVEIPTDDDNGN
jgi:single-stranded DNA-binding protein